MDNNKPDEKPQEDTFNAADIHNANLSDLMSSIDMAEEAPPQEPEQQEEPQLEETQPEPENTIQEPQQPQTIEEQVQEEAKNLGINEEQLTEKISQATVERVMEALAPKNLDTEEKKDILDDAPWKKEGRTPTWEEALKYVGEKSADKAAEKAADLAEQRVMEKLNKEVEDEEKAEQERVAKQTEEQQANQKAWNDYWEAQLNDMVVNKMIPPIKNAKDAKDPGIVARKELFTQLNKQVQDAYQKGRQPTFSLKEVYYEHYLKNKNNDIENGKNAPVYAGNKSGGSNDNKTFSYEEIKNATFEQLLSEQNGI